MSIFEANTESIHSAGSAILNSGNEYKSNISNIYGVLGELNSAWTGGASDKYATAFASYQKDLNNLGDAIIGMGNALQSAASTFDANENELASEASRL